MARQLIHRSSILGLSAMVCALAGIGVTAPSIAQADAPMSGSACFYAGNGFTGDSICAQNFTVFTPFVIQSYFNDARVSWCIETTSGKLIGIPAGGQLSKNANIDAHVVAPCSQLA